MLAVFSDTARKVCEGQQYDMNYETMPVVTMDDYIMMIGLKTSALIAGSAKLGAVLGGADAKSAEALYRYGYDLGLAFPDYRRLSGYFRGSGRVRKEYRRGHREQ